MKVQYERVPALRMQPFFPDPDPIFQVDMDPDLQYFYDKYCVILAEPDLYPQHGYVHTYKCINLYTTLTSISTRHVKYKINPGNIIRYTVYTYLCSTTPSISPPLC
jgi:hypothetical protein